MRGNRSLSLRPASTQKRAAGFGRQLKNCSPSAALKGRRSNRPASTQKRAAGFGRQFKNCAPSAAPKGDGAPIAPRPRESGPRVSGGNQGLPALSRPSGGRRSPERFPLTPSEKADWGRAERGKAAFFSANKKANSLERPFASGKARRLFLFYPVGFLGNARGEYAGATPPAVNRLGVNPFRSRRGNSS